MNKPSNYLLTIDSLKKINEDIYYVDYYFSYDLDNFLTLKSKNSISFYLSIKKILRKNLKLGCSTFDAHNAKNEHLFARNFDYKNSPALVMKINSSKGYKSICVTDLNFLLCGYKRNIFKHKKNLLTAPYLLMDGMNEKGLAIAVLELHDKPTKQTQNNKLTSTTLAMRVILDTCKNVDEAIMYLKSHNMRSLLGYDYHFQIVDKNKSVVVEYINNEIEIINKEGNYQCLTNHYISKNKIAKPLLLKSKGKQVDINGIDRIKIIKDTLNNKKGKLEENECMDLLYKVKQHYYFAYKHILHYYVDTIYSAIYNLNNLTLTISRNNKEFKFNL